VYSKLIKLYTHTHNWSSLAHTHIYSCLENHHGQKSLVDYSPWGCKKSDTTEQLSTAHSLFQLLFPCQLLQGIEYSSLCNMLGHFGLCISHIVVCIYWGRDKLGVWNYHCSFLSVFVFLFFTIALFEIGISFIIYRTHFWGRFSLQNIQLWVTQATYLHWI